jgi:hypothetical protein
MEHRHRCVYCGTQWGCDDDCVLDGAAACDECRNRLIDTPDREQRLIAVPLDTTMLQRLIHAETLRTLRGFFSEGG